MSNTERNGWTQAQRDAEKAMIVEAAVRFAEGQAQEARDRAAEAKAAEMGFTIGRISGAL